MENNNSNQGWFTEPYEVQLLPPWLPQRRFWRFAAEPRLRRIRRQILKHGSLEAQVRLLRVELRRRHKLNRRIKLVSSASLEVSQQMAEAVATFHAAFSNLAQALGQIKIPPLAAGSTNTYTDPAGVKP